MCRAPGAGARPAWKCLWRVALQALFSPSPPGLPAPSEGTGERRRREEPRLLGAPTRGGSAPGRWAREREGFWASGALVIFWPSHSHSDFFSWDVKNVLVL